MMNSELVQNNEQRILIPTVFREDYIGGLRKLSRQQDPDVYISMLERVHEYGSWLEPEKFDKLLNQLKNSNAFEESEMVF